jgi:hypothetical protein
MTTKLTPEEIVALLQRRRESEDRRLGPHAPVVSRPVPPAPAIDRPPTICPPLATTYPTARIRGRRITRLPEKYLDWAVLDAAAADELGREQVGWFVGGHPGLACASRQFGHLDANSEGGIWVVVPPSRDASCALFDQWPHTDHVSERPGSKNNFIWRSRKVWFAVPEDLEQLVPPARSFAIGVAGIIILDPHCVLYQDRGGTDGWGHTYRNDRPQHVVNFRASLDRDGWQPPLLLLTERPAKSVNTVEVARALCLNGFWFIAGDLFACWDEPIV